MRYNLSQLLNVLGGENVANPLLECISTTIFNALYFAHFGNRRLGCRGQGDISQFLFAGLDWKMLSQ